MSRDDVFLSLKNALANSADPDEMRHSSGSLLFANVPVKGFPVYKGLNKSVVIGVSWSQLHTTFLLSFNVSESEYDQENNHTLQTTPWHREEESHIFDTNRKVNAIFDFISHP